MPSISELGEVPPPVDAITWEDPAVLLFEVAKTSVRRVLSPGFPFSVKWASDRDLLLLPYDDRGELIGPNGAVLVKTNWTVAEYEHPHVFWTDRQSVV